MAQKSYSEKLKDPRWQKKRLEILERDQWACGYCGDKETTLHVHHFYYEKGKEPWEIEDHGLMAICADCHEIEHSRINFSPLERFMFDRLRLDYMLTHNTVGVKELFNMVKKYKTVEHGK
jgi:hypothetical protein